MDLHIELAAVGGRRAGIERHCAMPCGVAVGFLVVGAVLQVVAEMGQSAVSWQLSFELAQEGRVGEYQGLFGTGVTVARTLGPLLLTTLLVEWGTPGRLLLGGAMLAAS